jgi:hypothetical protein
MQNIGNWAFNIYPPFKEAGLFICISQLVNAYPILSDQ